VAQPPLYLIKRRKRQEYILNEQAMRQIQTSLGLEGAKLIVGANGDGQARELSGKKLSEMVELIDELNDLGWVLQRRGWALKDFLAVYRKRDGDLPSHLVVLDNEEQFFYSQKEVTDFLKEKDQSLGGLEVGGASEMAGQTDVGAHRARVYELHECKGIKRCLKKLEARGMDFGDYFGRLLEEGRVGEAAGRFRLEYGEEEAVQMEGLWQLAQAVREAGSRGLDVKRFKGLGEMNADELWETTMDPSRRSLLRVQMDDAAEADRIFSILMGANVERRREFIETHAAEVRNLDV
jgi:DNA gyrase subunit B